MTTTTREVSFVGRRIVTAIGARWTPEDVLVDSVVAWENLVGGAPETTFRTSTAMACLLEQDPNARLLMQHRLGVIYGARSDVVHGRLEKDVAEWKWRLAEGTEKVGLDAVAEEALQTAMRGLKTDWLRQPDLRQTGRAIKTAGHGRLRHEYGAGAIPRPHCLRNGLGGRSPTRGRSFTPPRGSG